MIENLEQYFQINPNAFRYNAKLNKYIAKSVHFKDRERFDLAKEQKAKSIVSVSNIIKLVNDILKFAGIKEIEEKAMQEVINIKPQDIHFDFSEIERIVLRDDR